MLRRLQENEKPPASPVLPALGMVAVIVARTFGYLTLNDHLTRALLFIPLFTVFLMRIHRETVYKVLPGPVRARTLLFGVTVRCCGVYVSVVHKPNSRLWWEYTQDRVQYKARYHSDHCYV